MTMNSPALNSEQLATRLKQIRQTVGSWLQERQVEGKPYGVFQLCAGAYAKEGELNGSTGALELWVMLGLPLSMEQRESAIRTLKGYQNPDSGLVFDSSWTQRQANPQAKDPQEGDSFFTMTTSSALRALGSRFDYPVRYLSELTPDHLIERTQIGVGAHNPFALGDFGELVGLNIQLSVPGASDQWNRLLTYLAENQDPETGLWPVGKIVPPYTRHINRSFHLMRTTWNTCNYPYPRAERIIDTCLQAADDTQFYDWTNGFACNDLDLAVMLYSAAQWTKHRREEVGQWAQRRLPLVLAVQKEDGGFSFFHDRAMEDHAGIAMSPGYQEGDTWGTLMYMGTIKMMVELGYPRVIVPWNFSQVHRVPSTGVYQ
ncbi:hypothetical protein GW916_13930 [bacterium]|nr:hypothetical protein [bacterium]